MSSDKKKPVWISIDAHEKLKEYCDENGRTQVDVVSELLYRFLKPQIEKLEGKKK